MRACTIEMHLDISQQPLYMEIYRKSAWKPRRRLCASLRSRSASQHFRRATLYGNLQVKCRRPNRGPHLARACTVEMHSEISQEPLYTEIYRKNAAAQLEHPDQAPAFTLIVRTPQCGHAVWEKEIPVWEIQWDPDWLQTCSSNICKHLQTTK